MGEHQGEGVFHLGLDVALGGLQLLDGKGHVAGVRIISKVVHPRIIDLVGQIGGQPFGLRVDDVGLFTADEAMDLVAVGIVDGEGGAGEDLAVVGVDLVHGHALVADLVQAVGIDVFNVHLGGAEFDHAGKIFDKNVARRRPGLGDLAVHRLQGRAAADGLGIVHHGLAVGDPCAARNGRGGGGVFLTHAILAHGDAEGLGEGIDRHHTAVGQGLGAHCGLAELGQRNDLPAVFAEDIRPADVESRLAQMLGDLADAVVGDGGAGLLGLVVQDADGLDQLQAAPGVGGVGNVNITHPLQITKAAIRRIDAVFILKGGFLGGFLGRNAGLRGDLGLGLRAAHEHDAVVQGSNNSRFSRFKRYELQTLPEPDVHGVNLRGGEIALGRGDLDEIQPYMTVLIALVTRKQLGGQIGRQIGVGGVDDEDALFVADVGLDQFALDEGFFPGLGIDHIFAGIQAEDRAGQDDKLLRAAVDLADGQGVVADLIRIIVVDVGVRGAVVALVHDDAVFHGGLNVAVVLAEIQAALDLGGRAGVFLAGSVVLDDRAAIADDCIQDIALHLGGFGILGHKIAAVGHLKGVGVFQIGLAPGNFHFFARFPVDDGHHILLLHRLAEVGKGEGDRGEGFGAGDRKGHALGCAGEGDLAGAVVADADALDDLQLAHAVHAGVGDLNRSAWFDVGRRFAVFVQLQAVGPGETVAEDPAGFFVIVLADIHTALDLGGFQRTRFSGPVGFYRFSISVGDRQDQPAFVFLHRGEVALQRLGLLQGEGADVELPSAAVQIQRVEGVKDPLRGVFIVGIAGDEIRAGMLIIFSSIRAQLAALGVVDGELRAAQPLAGLCVEDPRMEPSVCGFIRGCILHIDRGRGGLALVYMRAAPRSFGLAGNLDRPAEAGNFEGASVDHIIACGHALQQAGVGIDIFVLGLGKVVPVKLHDLAAVAGRAVDKDGDLLHTAVFMQAVDRCVRREGDADVEPQIAHVLFRGQVADPKCVIIDLDKDGLDRRFRLGAGSFAQLDGGDLRRALPAVNDGIQAVAVGPDDHIVFQAGVEIAGGGLVFPQDIPTLALAPGIGQIVLEGRVVGADDQAAVFIGDVGGDQLADLIGFWAIRGIQAEFRAGKEFEISLFHHFGSDILDLIDRQRVLVAGQTLVPGQNDLVFIFSGLHGKGEGGGLPVHVGGLGAQHGNGVFTGLQRIERRVKFRRLLVGNHLQIEERPMIAVGTLYDHHNAPGVLDPGLLLFGMEDDIQARVVVGGVTDAQHAVFGGGGAGERQAADDLGDHAVVILLGLLGVGAHDLRPLGRAVVENGSLSFPQIKGEGFAVFPGTADHLIERCGKDLKLRLIPAGEDSRLDVRIGSVIITEPKPGALQQLVVFIHDLDGQVDKLVFQLGVADDQRAVVVQQAFVVGSEGKVPDELRHRAGFIGHFLVLAGADELQRQIQRGVKDRCLGLFPGAFNCPRLIIKVHGAGVAVFRDFRESGHRGRPFGDVLHVQFERRLFSRDERASAVFVTQSERAILRLAVGADDLDRQGTVVELDGDRFLDFLFLLLCRGRLDVLRLGLHGDKGRFLHCFNGGSALPAQCRKRVDRCRLQQHHQSQRDCKEPVFPHAFVLLLRYMQ